MYENTVNIRYSFPGLNKKFFSWLTLKKFSLAISNTQHVICLHELGVSCMEYYSISQSVTNLTPLIKCCIDVVPIDI